MLDDGPHLPERSKPATTILALDKDPGLLRFLARILSKYRVLVADTEDAALRLVTTVQEPIDLLLLGPSEPEASRQNVVQYFARYRPQTKLLFMQTAQAPVARAETLHVVQQPFSSGALRRKITSVLKPAIRSR